MDFKLEDSTSENVPQDFIQIVQTILADCQPSDLAKQQIFLTLIINIISENGLPPKTEEPQADDNYKFICIHQKSKWKQPSGIYEIPLIMSSFPETKIKLIMVPVHSSVLLNIFINNNNYEVYTACVPMSKYIVPLESSNLAKMFQDVKHLSFTLKNKIINPAKSSVLKFFGYVSASLVGLPQELLFNILINLPIVDIVNIANTCTRLNLLLKNDHFWHSLFERDFKSKTKDTNMDWKSAYIEEYSSLNTSRTPYHLGPMLFDYMDFPESSLHYPLSFL